MTSIRSHHLIKLLMFIGISIQQRISFTKILQAYNVTHLMVDYNHKLLKMVRRICEITVTLDFIFLLLHCSSGDVSFNSICPNVLEGIKQFYLLMWFKKTRLETPIKGDNVKALVKTSKCENLVLCFFEKV